jgi:hypothetical protein
MLIGYSLKDFRAKYEQVQMEQGSQEQALFEKYHSEHLHCEIRKHSLRTGS